MLEIVRYGVMHRNTFINSPKVIKAYLSIHDVMNNYSLLDK